MNQQGEGVRVPTTAVAGGSIIVNVGPNASHVEVDVLGSNGPSKSYEVEANKDTPLPVPSVPGGTVLVIRVGKPPNQRRILVTVIAPSPKP